MPITWDDANVGAKSSMVAVGGLQRFSVLMWPDACPVRKTTKTALLVTVHLAENY